MNKYLIILLAVSSLILSGCNSPGNAQGSEIGGEDASTMNSGAQYARFDSVKYDQALADGKIVLLDFYANWCPICRSENPGIIAGLKQVSGDDAAGFQVHYNDDETTEEDKELAKKFGITLQHTKVIVKDGELISKSLEIWSKDKTIEELNRVI